MKKKILVLCFTDTRHDMRVARQIDFLKDTYHVSFAGYQVHCPDEITFLPLPQVPLTPVRKSALASLLLARQYETAYWVQYPYQWLREHTDQEQYDIILANDIESLPLAFYLKGDSSARVVFDAHEYAPRHFEDRLYWRVFFQGFNTYFCKKFIPRVDRMFTVCDGLAEAYEQNFGVRPLIMTNAASYHDLAPSPVAEDAVRLIHHGVITLSRKIENMITMMDHVDERFSLDIMLKLTSTASHKTKEYLKHLQDLAATKSNVRIIPPLPSRDIVPFIHQYDLGISFFLPVNFNYTHALPNKLFDFVQARLGVGISPSKEMKKVVEKYQLGVVASDFSPRALASQLNRLTRTDVETFKQNSHQAARELSAEHNRKLLLNTLLTLEEEPLLS